MKGLLNIRYNFTANFAGQRSTGIAPTSVGTAFKISSTDHTVRTECVIVNFFAIANIGRNKRHLCRLQQGRLGYIPSICWQKDQQLLMEKDKMIILKKKIKYVCVDPNRRCGTTFQAYKRLLTMGDRWAGRYHRMGFLCLEMCAVLSVRYRSPDSPWLFNHTN